VLHAVAGFWICDLPLLIVFTLLVPASTSSRPFHLLVCLLPLDWFSILCVCLCETDAHARACLCARVVCIDIDLGWLSDRSSLTVHQSFDCLRLEVMSCIMPTPSCWRRWRGYRLLLCVCSVMRIVVCSSLVWCVVSDLRETFHLCVCVVSWFDCWWRC
jgi:hypothetical protein